MVSLHRNRRENKPQTVSKTKQTKQFANSSNNNKTQKTGQRWCLMDGTGSFSLACTCMQTHRRVFEPAPPPPHGKYIKEHLKMGEDPHYLVCFCCKSSFHYNRDGKKTDSCKNSYGLKAFPIAERGNPSQTLWEGAFLG